MYMHYKISVNFRSIEFSRCKIPVDARLPGIDVYTRRRRGERRPPLEEGRCCCLTLRVTLVDRMRYWSR